MLVRPLKPTAPLPRFQCHKQVEAFKIDRVQFNSRGRGEIFPADPSITQPFEVDFSYLSKHQPKPGGYYVRYEDGYESYSPAEAFEAGYTPMCPDADELTSVNNHAKTLLSQYALCIVDIASHPDEAKMAFFFEGQTKPTENHVAWFHHCLETMERAAAKP